jgi:hypothetical protein
VEHDPLDLIGNPPDLHRIAGGLEAIEQFSERLVGRIVGWQERFGWQGRFSVGCQLRGWCGSTLFFGPRGRNGLIFLRHTLIVRD